MKINSSLLPKNKIPVDDNEININWERKYQQLLEWIDSGEADLIEWTKDEEPETSTTNNADISPHNGQIPTKEDKQCGICLENVKVQGLLNSCNHPFCYDCIFEWSRTSNTCPFCKKRFGSLNKIDLSTGTKMKNVKVKHADQRPEYSDPEEWIEFDEEDEDEFLDDFPLFPIPFQFFEIVHSMMENHFLEQENLFRGLVPFANTLFHPHSSGFTPNNPPRRAHPPLRTNSVSRTPQRNTRAPRMQTPSHPTSLNLPIHSNRRSNSTPTHSTRQTRSQTHSLD